MPEFKITDPLSRAFLQNRIQGFLPRIKKMTKTKSPKPVFTLDELAADLERTLAEFKDRAARSV